jgi:hypothetical protein
MQRWTLSLIAVAIAAAILAVAFSITAALTLAMVCFGLAFLLMAGFLFERAASA